MTTTTITLPRAGGHSGIRAAFTRTLSETAQTLKTWLARARQRRQLAELSPDLLRDVGLTPGDAWLESRKPFWKA